MSEPARVGSWQWFFFSLMAALLLCWPVLIEGRPFVFFDTLSYWTVGEDVLGLLNRSADAVGQQATGGGGGTAQGRSLRSAPYSLFVATFQTQSFLVLAVLQAWMLTLSGAQLVPFKRLNARRASVAFMAVGALTTLPWYVAYVMPDILAAVIVIYYMLMLWRVDLLSWPVRIVLLSICGFAILSHYGHLPFGFALCCAAIAARLWHRRLSWTVVLLCALPIVGASGVNVVSSRAVLKETSVAPKRLPILLARSIEDGPAARYLAVACPEADYAICTLFTELPSNVGAFLWGPNGIRTLSPEQLSRIRDEEIDVLIGAFRAYPVQQTTALLENWLLQLVRIGTDDVLVPPEGQINQDWDINIERERPLLLELADMVTPVTTALAFAVLVLLTVTGRLDRRTRSYLGFILLSLLINAAIFGGLSAPVDRYQSRMAWLLPALLGLAWACRFRLGPVIGHRSTV